MHRRTFLQMAAGLPFASLAGAPVYAATAWPTKTVTVVVGVAAGGQADIAARAISVGLQKVGGQSVVVDNRTGAGGAIGAASVVRADPDGHTLLMALSAAVVLPEAERLAGRKPLYEMSQFTPVARVLGDPNLLVVQSSSPYKTVKDLVDDAKSAPAKCPMRAAAISAAPICRWRCSARTPTSRCCMCRIVAVRRRSPV